MSKKSHTKKLPQWLSGLPKHTVKELPKSVNQVSSELQPQVDEYFAELTYSGKLVYSTNIEECYLLCDDLLTSSVDAAAIAVGFDMEWPVNYVRGQEDKVALIQLCFGEEDCYLFHIAAMKEFPGMLGTLLQNSNLMFVGVGIESDLWKLERNFDIRVLPIIRSRMADLSVMANDVLKSSERWSLDNLTRHLLGKKLNKDPAIRTGHWDKWPLTDQQQIYAATDAYASWKIYHELLQRKTTKSI